MIADNTDYVDETEMLARIRASDHGQKFTETVNQVMITIAERILMEDVDGLIWLDRVGVVLNHYTEFRMREAITTFNEIRPELHAFVTNLRWNRDNSVARIRTWDTIERILIFLVKDGELFLEIANSAILG